MGKKFIGVRDVDEETFRKFKVMSVEEKMKLGLALTIAMKRLLEEKKIGNQTLPDPANLIKITGIIKTKEKVKWSEEIDEILYGENDNS